MIKIIKITLLFALSVTPTVCHLSQRKRLGLANTAYLRQIKFRSSLFKGLWFPKAKPLVALRRERNTCRGGERRYDHSVFFKSGGECHRLNSLCLYSLVKLTNLTYPLIFKRAAKPPSYI